ncbi:MAG TPA: efflux RND transporter periplasmic adaptor subunit [Chthonomonadaceae bacterium]|nr:efflux RND transporter periplasmic adaptor subunit [Chthonomonadaceae bacterium]
METTTHTPPTPISGGKIRFGLLALVVTLGALFVMGLLPRMHNQEHLSALAQETRTSAPVVTTVTPRLASDADLLLPGNIQAIEETTVIARTSGYLKKRYVDIGFRVKAGDLLAEIESPEIDQQLSQADADSARSQATVGQSQADVTRLQALVTQAQSDAARQKAGVKQTQAQLAGTQSRLAQAEAAQATAEAKVQQALQALEVQRANLQQAQAQKDLADSTFERYDKLLKQGFVAQQDVDEKQAGLKTAAANVQATRAAIQAAQADVDAAKQEVKSSESAVHAAQADVQASQESVTAADAALKSSEANVDAARSSVHASQATVSANRAAFGSSQANARRYEVLRSFEKVVAPFDGVITVRNVDTGSLVKADTDPSSTKGLFGIARTDVLRVQINVPQALLNALRPGQPARILIREFPGRTFTGTIFQSAGALDPTSRTLLTEVHIPNPDNLLRPGMYAQVQITPANVHTRPRIPANTLITNAAGTQVASVTPEGTVHLIPVQIGRDFGPELEITQGLQGNEALITNPSDDLKEGTKVQATAAPPAQPAVH